MNEPREDVYFTDRDLGRKFPETLKAAGLVVVTHDDEFGPLTPDDEWLAKVGANRWLGITRDARIRYSPLALRVLMQTGARLFVLVGNLTTEECADLVIGNRRKIESLAASEPGAFIAKIRRDGVHLWISLEGWKKRFDE
jgi:PIN like domain